MRASIEIVIVTNCSTTNTNRGQSRFQKWINLELIVKCLEIINVSEAEQLPVDAIILNGAGAVQIMAPGLSSVHICSVHIWGER